jgi:hypothetical protein
MSDDTVLVMWNEFDGIMDMIECFDTYEFEEKA